MLLAVLLAGGTATVLTARSGHDHHRPAAAGKAARSGPGRALSAAAALRHQAAGWVWREISRSAIVACDPAMCDALQRKGLAAANLQVLNTGASDPLGADVVVATPAVRADFGRRLARIYAPVTMARFGAGAAQIQIRVEAPGGAATYEAALGQDVQARKNAAAQLLSNRNFQASPAARVQLVAGQVDARLLTVLVAVADMRRVQVLSFGDRGPGADAGIPFASAQLAGGDHPASMSEAAYTSWLRGFLKGQRPPYNSQASTAQQHGETVVTAHFAMPGPLGLLKGG